MSKIQVKALYNRMKTSSHSLGVCPITGIILTIEVPFLPASIGVLEYKNPISFIENARSISQLPYSEQRKISPHILAGSLLSILCHYEKIEDHLSSLERNAELSTVPIYYLCEVMRFYTSQTARKIAKFPSISLSFVDTLHTSTFDILKNHLEICQQSLIENSYIPLTATERELKKIEDFKEKKEEFINSLTVETKKRAKDLVNTIIKSEVLNTKLISLLKLLLTGNNLVTVHGDVRSKLITKFSSMNSSESQEFAVLLQQIEKQSSPKERIFKQESDEVLNTMTSELPEYKVKRSLKEILAEKTAKSLDTAKQQPSKDQPSSSIQTSTKEETTNFKSIEEIESSKTDICSLMLQAQDELLESEIEDSSFDPNEF